MPNDTLTSKTRSPASRTDPPNLTWTRLTADAGFGEYPLNCPTLVPAMYGDHPGDPLQPGYVLLGGDGVVGPDRPRGITWRTRGGAHWASQTTTYKAREGAAAWPLNNGIVMFGGEGDDGIFRDLWTCADKTWTQHSLIEPAPRARNNAAVATAPTPTGGAGLFLIAGSGPSGKSLTNAWYSPNGLQWSERTNTLPFSGSSGGAAFFDPTSRLLWYFGGSGGTQGGAPEYCAEAWYSPDSATTWHRQTPAPPWSGRSNMASAFLNNVGFCLIGGIDSSGAPREDVWIMRPDGSWIAGPPVPTGVANAAACGGDRILVAGGSLFGEVWALEPA